MTQSPFAIAPLLDEARSRAAATLCAEVPASERDELYTLLSTYFDDVTRERFEADFSEKDWVLRVRRGERLVGFSTMRTFGTEFEGRRLNVVYSGDTIMAPEAWGSPVLACAWIALVRRIQGHRATEPWYWLLLSSGFRTYRFLPLFYREFWPRHDAATPPEAARLIAHLARERFGGEYSEQRGIVRFAAPQRLRDALALVPEGKQRDAHVEFFLAQNPGHARGDELVCLAALADTNLTAAAARMERSSVRILAP